MQGYKVFEALSTIFQLLTFVKDNTSSLH